MSLLMTHLGSGSEQVTVGYGNGRVCVLQASFKNNVSSCDN